MAFPIGTPTVTLTGTLPGAAVGTPFAGRVVLTPSAELIDTTRHAIYAGGGRVDFASNGTFSVVLIPNNAAGILPAGWKWQVDVQPMRGRRITFWTDIHGANGATIHLDSLVPVPAPGGGPGPGPAGESAYEVAVAEGFVGTITEWLASLIGPAGADGSDGADGQDGATGAQGPQGTQGATGATGSTGPKGDKGDQGDAGDPATNLVQSVNGDTGTVVLNASDVGADTDGSAAAAQSAAVTTAAADATTKVSGHSADTTAVHGIANTAALETTTGAQTKATAAQTAATTAAATDATTKVATHAAAADPHGDRSWATGQFDAAGAATAAQAAAATDATGKVAAHTAAADPHADRAWVSSLFALLADSRLTDARTPTAHASTHAAAGGDPVTLTQAQITGLTAALAALAQLAGADFTGPVKVIGDDLTVQREDGEGAYRLRVTGGGLDFEVGGMDVIVSLWAEPDFTGTQTAMMRWEPAGPHLIGRVQVGTTPYDTVFDFDAPGGKAGFLGAPAVAKQVVDGSWADGTAGASLAAAMAAFGFITDTTTP